MSLNENLNLRDSRQANTQSNRQTARKQFFLPIGMTNLMQPLMAAKATTKTTAPLQQRPVSVVVSEYYTDATKIPQYAVDDVAVATQAGIVVNHPNIKILNPTQPASRGAVAAFIYQALVNQGRLNPISSNVAASKYIVGRTEISAK